MVGTHHLNLEGTKVERLLLDPFSAFQSQGGVEGLELTWELLSLFTALTESDYQTMEPSSLLKPPSSQSKGSLSRPAT